MSPLPVTSPLPTTSSQTIPIPVTALETNCIQQLNPIEVYSWLLLPQGRGYPLWKPKSDSSHLPKEYRKDGVHIGDQIIQLTSEVFLRILRSWNWTKLKFQTVRMNLHQGLG
ncbi:hypothetical protein BT96DRAFT_220011 [Gymnopus androsaceus JB14]|uniref:Uncharacterized protein n=1 Tax=Gymnopus androsaceus JB14 TaxID=1447944 RepID=A0A6A4I3T8_9AGAR|nr:hypothetical protein BT96DRAFT_220011 [Gymnopus androsaceus JB14]